MSKDRREGHHPAMPFTEATNKLARQLEPSEDGTGASQTPTSEPERAAASLA